MIGDEVAAGSVVVEFCGEHHPVDPATPYWIGRDADLVVDDNPYLHRRFLAVVHADGGWWLVNGGRLLSATVQDGTGLVRSSLAPGARLPLVSDHLTVLFTAGSTTYGLELHGPGVPLGAAPQHRWDGLSGDTTVGPVVLTESQRLLLVALCEPLLRRSGAVGAVLPSSAAAARRLGWPLTTFNRKLDNVCEKFDRRGVSGLRGGPGQLASGRRARLVEHVVASHIITEADLALLRSRNARAAASP